MRGNGQSQRFPRVDCPDGVNLKHWARFEMLVNAPAHSFPSIVKTTQQTLFQGIYVLLGEYADQLKRMVPVMEEANFQLQMLRDYAKRTQEILSQTEADDLAGICACTSMMEKGEPCADSTDFTGDVGGCKVIKALMARNLNENFERPDMGPDLRIVGEDG